MTIFRPRYSLALVIACACGSPPTRPPETPRNTAPVESSLLADPLALLPADSDLVMKLDLAALRKSPLFRAHRDMFRDFILPGFADCGYDPLDDIDTITVGIPMNESLGVFILRGLDRDKVLHCLRTSKIETKTDAIFDGELVFLRNKSGKANLLKFVGPRSAVIQGSTDPTKETLAAALKVGAPLREVKPFIDAQRSLARGAVISIVAQPASDVARERLAASLGAPISGMTATMHASDVITAHVAIEMPEASQADAVIDHIRPQLAGLRQLVERYDIRAEGRKVIVDLVVTETQIQMIAAFAKRTTP